MERRGAIMAETSAVELSETILHDVFGYESFRGQQLDVVSWSLPAAMRWC